MGFCNETLLEIKICESAVFNITANGDVTFRFVGGVPFIVNWGDGTAQEITTSPATVTHTYTNFTGEMTIGNSDCTTVGMLRFDTETATVNDLTVDISQFAQLPDLNNIDLRGDSLNITGDIGSLDDTLVRMTVLGVSTTSGDIGSLPSGLVYYNVQGLNTTSGDIGSLPATLTFFRNRGNNTVSGDIGSLPAGLGTYDTMGFNTTSGDVGSLPAGLTSYVNQGSNTTFGDVANLPAGLLTYNNIGLNTVTGNLSDLPATLEIFNSQGNNTVTGDISDLPSTLTVFRFIGNGSVTGDLADLPVNTVSVLVADTVNNISAYSGKVWPASMREVYLTGAGFTLSSAEVDQLLIDLAATTWIGDAPDVRITGSSGSPTAASAAAIATLTGMGVTVITN